MTTIPEDAVLCYVCLPMVYFTTQPLGTQWGDDWDDAPYEHNAGTPYSYHDKRDGEPWEISSVMLAGPFETPDTTSRKHLSVQEINSGTAPWLTSEPWTGKNIRVPAGATYRDFLKMVREGGGAVYAPVPVGSK